jgi:2'-5' RNA ligase
VRDATQSAVIVPVAEAEPVVGRHRRELDVAVSWGVPAHVTVVFPFVPPARIDAEVVSRLRAVVAAIPAFECAFTDCRWFGEDVLWLAPEDDGPFLDLTRAVSAEFPECPPYGGAYDDVVPHLTIGGRRRGSLGRLQEAEAAVAAELPVAARIDHALLIAGSDAADSWRTAAVLPLGS